jgi:hypothetical protein
VDSGHADRETAHRVAVVRGWLAAAVAFAVTFLAIRWAMRRIWPDQGDLSDLGTDLLRVSVSLSVATATAIAVGLWAGRRPD